VSWIENSHDIVNCRMLCTVAVRDFTAATELN